MRTMFKVSIAVLFFTVLAWASNPWETKPYTQWSEKEVSQVLNDSPWAKITSVPVTWKVPRGESRRDERGAYGPQDKIEVRWISAKVIREAMAREFILRGTMTAKQAQSYVEKSAPGYELALLSTDLSQFSKMTDADAAKAAYIEGKRTKVKAVAAQAKVYRGSGGQVTAVLFAFPKNVGGKAVVGPAETQLNFNLSANKLNLKLHFDTQKMTTKDGFDL